MINWKIRYIQNFSYNLLVFFKTLWANYFSIALSGLDWTDSNPRVKGYSKTLLLPTTQRVKCKHKKLTSAKILSKDATRQKNESRWSYFMSHLCLLWLFFLHKSFVFREIYECLKNVFFTLTKFLYKN